MNIEKQLRRYIMPNIFAMAGMSCYILADTFFISVSEGANGITALNLSMPIYSLIFACGSMIGMGFATQFMLTKVRAGELSDKMFSYAVECELIFSAIFILIGIFCPDTVNAGYFSATNAPKESFVIAISRGVISIVAFAFILSAILGITGVWLSFPAAELFTLLIALRFSKSQKGRIGLT